MNKLLFIKKYYNIKIYFPVIIAILLTSGVTLKADGDKRKQQTIRSIGQSGGGGDFKYAQTTYRYLTVINRFTYRVLNYFILNNHKRLEELANSLDIQIDWEQFQLIFKNSGDGNFEANLDEEFEVKANNHGLADIGYLGYKTSLPSHTGKIIMYKGFIDKYDKKELPKSEVLEMQKSIYREAAHLVDIGINQDDYLAQQFSFKLQKLLNFTMVMSLLRESGPIEKLEPFYKFKGRSEWTVNVPRFASQIDRTRIRSDIPVWLKIEIKCSALTWSIHGSSSRNGRICTTQDSEYKFKVSEDGTVKVEREISDFTLLGNAFYVSFYLVTDRSSEILEIDLPVTIDPLAIDGVTTENLTELINNVTITGITIAK